jgi:sigma-B regulation protein RsbQ
MSDVDSLYGQMQSNYQAWADGFANSMMANAKRPGLAATLAATLAAMRPDIAMAVARTIFSADHRADLPGHRIPTLIVQSRADRAVPMQVGQYLARHIAGSQLELIDAFGHLPHLSAPEQVTFAPRRFLG